MPKHIEIEPSPEQRRSWRDYTTLNILTVSLLLAVAAGVLMAVYWDRLMAFVPR